MKNVFKNNSPTQLFIVINALFLIVLLFLGKADPMAIVFAYVFETIIIGVFHFLKLLIIALHSRSTKINSKLLDLSYTFFFLIHYGAFVAIQSIIIYTAFAIKDHRFSTSLKFSNFTDLVLLEGFFVIALSIVMMHIASFLFSFLREKKYQSDTVVTTMIKPYLRVFIQQFLAIIPLFFLYFTDKVGLVAAILLVGVRAFLDFYFYQVSQNPEEIKRLATKILRKEKPQELSKIEESLKAFFEV